MSAPDKLPRIRTGIGSENRRVAARCARAAEYRRCAYFVDKVLKGSMPADLPVELPTKFWLTVNLKTAKALGITMPPTIMARADEVIE
jgi:ABC-type uncharacterized transport system substrate-binding protein